MCRDLADAMGRQRGAPQSEDGFNIYDGAQMVFKQSPWSVLTLLRMVRRWGLSYFRLAERQDRAVARSLVPLPSRANGISAHFTQELRRPA